MDNPEKLATQGTQDEDKQNKNTTQYVFDTTKRKQNFHGHAIAVLRATNPPHSNNKLIYKVAHQYRVTGHGG